MQYILEGTPNSPVLVLSNSLGSTLHMWDRVVPYLLPYFRVLRYDTRGHGQNAQQGLDQEVWQIADLGRDVVTLWNELNIDKVYFCGLSMGGLVGQWLGIHHPERLINLALCHTAAKIGDEDRWNARIETLEKDGLGAIVNDTLDRWFTPSFFEENPTEVDQFRRMFLDSPVPGYIRCCAAIRDADFRAEVAKIPVKTWVVTGTYDPVTNAEQAEYLQQSIPQTTLTLLPARHLSASEMPEAFAEHLIVGWLGANRFDRGMHIRRTVLGDAHVDRATANITPLSADFQSFITEYAWGEIWARPGLSKSTRSLITVAMLIALNRKNELLMHFKAAYNNGVSREEIKEVILHAGIYCGLPAANDALHLFQEFDQTNTPI